MQNAPAVVEGYSGVKVQVLFHMFNLTLYANANRNYRETHLVESKYLFGCGRSSGVSLNQVGRVHIDERLAGWMDGRRGDHTLLRHLSFDERIV